MAQLFTARVESNVSEVLKEDLAGLLRASRKVIGGRGRYLVGAVRRVLRRAGLSERLANAVRGYTKDLPDGAESVTFSRAKVRRSTGTYDLVALLEADQTIVTSGARFMAIPTPVAGRGPGNRPARPSDYPPGSLVAFVNGPGGVLVSREELRRNRGVGARPLFILTNRIHRPQKIDLERVKRTAGEDLGGRIVREWASKRASQALRLVGNL